MAEKKVIEIEIQDNTKSLKAQYREAVQEVQKLVQAYGETSQEAAQAAKRAAELKDQIEDTNDAIAAFKGEGVFNATGKAISSVASGFSAVEGAVALVGVESEALQETMVRLQAAMALSQGLQGLEDAGRAFGTLQTLAVNAFTGMTTASKVFLVTGIGLLLAGLGAMIAYWDDISEAIGINNKYLTANTKAKELNQKETEKLNNELERQKALTSELTEIIDFQTRETLTKAKARGASEKELNSIIVEGVKRRIEVLKQNELEAQKEYIKMSKSGSREQYELAEKNWKEQLRLRKEAQLTLLELQSDYQAKVLAKSKEIEKIGLTNEQLDELLAESLKKLSEPIVLPTPEFTDEPIDLSIVEEATHEVNNYWAELELGALKSFEGYKTLLHARMEEELRVTRATGAQAEAIRKKYGDLETARANEIHNKKIQMAVSAFDAIGNLIQSFNTKDEANARKQFKIAKAFNLASALTNTFLAVTGALTAGGNPIKLATGQQIAEASIVGTMGLANVAKIASTQFNSSGGSIGGGSSMSSGGGGIVAPNLNVVGDTGINQLAQLGQTPIKAYVVSNDITTAQMFDLKVQQTASL